MVFKRRNGKAFKLSIYDSIELVNREHWELLQEDRNIYLSIPYLCSLQESMADSVGFRYMIFYDENVEPIGIAYVQILQFDSIGNDYAEFLPKFGDKVSRAVLNKLDVKIMLCGNAFVGGENGYGFNKELDSKEALVMLNKGLERLREYEKADNYAAVFLIKEFWQSNFEESKQLLKNGYKDFNIDVNMILKISPHWNSLDDYLSDMNTKFRTKAKAAFKRSKDLVIKEMRFAEIEKHTDRIQELFANVLKRSSFKLSDLRGESFLNFKKELKENNIFIGYFLDQKMIGFSSSFIDKTYLDANYVGLDYDYNTLHALYSRMLYDFVEMSIKKGMTELRLGRTAEEIKSGVGALPEEMKLYIKHTNSLSNTLLKGLVSNVKPNPFELRRPFKAEFYED